MPSADELAAEARLLSVDERWRLIALIEESLVLDVAEEEPRRGWTRDLWEETPEYRVGAAQAISLKEVQRRLSQQSWPGWFQ
jgi:hypothetical protein